MTSTANGLNVVRTGSGGGPPVLLLHPAGLDLTHWVDSIEALRRDHDVVAYDLAGHGRSPMGTDDMGWARQVRDAAAVLDKGGAHSAHVVGISYGSMIAQHLALAHSTRVSSLVLIGSAAGFPEEVRAGMRDRARRLREGGMAAVIDETVARWFTDATQRERPHVIDRTVKTLLGDNPEAHARVWETVSTQDTEAHLGDIGCPTLVLVGEADPSTTPAAARFLQQHIAAAHGDLGAAWAC